MNKSIFNKEQSKLSKLDKGLCIVSILACITVLLTYKITNSLPLSLSFLTTFILAKIMFLFIPEVKVNKTLFTVNVLACVLVSLIYPFTNNLVLSLSLFTIFVFSGIVFLYVSTINSPIEVNSEGIKNNTNGMGLIKWEFINGFEIKKGINGNFLVANIVNQEKLLREVNSVSRFLMKTNIKPLGSPVVISEETFNEPLESVLCKIKAFQK